jgi:ATP-dependent Clp protease ATP-binding subunit ClpA
MGHSAIDTGHVLLAMLGEDGGIAGRVLRGLNVQWWQVFEWISGLSKPQTLENSPAAVQRVVEHAADEARGVGNPAVGSEHLLLALVQETEGTAHDVLKRLNISPDAIQEVIERVLVQDPDTVFPAEFVERCRQRARFALTLAFDHATQMQHSAVDSHHLLVGLLREERGAAGRVLRALGLQIERVENVINELTSCVPRANRPPHELSIDVKRVLELAVDQAQRLAQVLNYETEYIGTESLLLALVRHEGCMAVEVLKRCGVHPPDVRWRTRKVLQASRTEINDAE